MRSRRPNLAKLAAAMGLALALPGCGGLAVSPSVSPLSFLLPGFVHNAEPALDPMSELTETNAALIASIDLH